MQNFCYNFSWQQHTKTGNLDFGDFKKCKSIQNLHFSNFTETENLLCHTRVTKERGGGKEKEIVNFQLFSAIVYNNVCVKNSIHSIFYAKCCFLIDIWYKLRILNFFLKYYFPQVAMNLNSFVRPCTRTVNVTNTIFKRKYSTVNLTIIYKFHSILNLITVKICYTIYSHILKCV